MKIPAPLSQMVPSQAEAPFSHVTPRAQRFAARLKGLPEASFAGLMRKARFENAAQANRQLVAEVLALLDVRAVIDVELSGKRLSGLAARIGEDLFDRVCECELPDALLSSIHSPLPKPGDIAAMGEKLLARSDDDPRLSNLAAIALSLVQETVREEAA